MSAFLRVLWKVLTEFRGYEPQPVNLLTFYRWLAQLPPSARADACLLLDYVRYIGREEIRESLLALNSALTDRLHADSIGPERTIYVSIDTAGSSSHVILNMLRDACNLERKHATLLDSKNIIDIAESTGKLKQGAIVYVDDFCGTGRQFRTNRDWSASFIQGTFSEFLLSPVICEEALERLTEVGVEPLASIIHYKTTRPLHPEASIIRPDAKVRIVKMCQDMNENFGLGFEALATCVVLNRNAPNSTPLLLRGNLRQKPLRGIFPRSDDLDF
jgi:hypothetical protein